MKPVIHIGNKIDKKFISNIVRGTTVLLRECHNTHTDQKTTRHVITEFMKQVPVSNVSLSNITITQEKE